MKRLILISAVLLAGIPTTHAAVTLTPGEQINRVWRGANNGGQSGLMVLGTYSGTNLLAVKSITGTDLYGVRIAGAGLVSCSASNSKLLYTSATKQFSCATDQNTAWSNTGSLQTAFDARYVNTSGDTMTGALRVLQSMSGNTLFVSKGATFAGTGVTISASGAAVFNEQSRAVDFRIESDGNVNAFFVDASTDRVGVMTNAPKATLDVLGTSSGTDLYAADSVSGSNLFANKTFGGAGLVTCSDATTSKLLYNSTTKRFACGTDQTGGSSGNWSNTGSLKTAFDARYVNTFGDTMTGALRINLTSGTIGLNVLQIMSGTTLYVSKGATLAGTGIVITASGQTVFNEQSRAVDFRIESDGDVNAFFVDASTDRVGIGTNGPETKLEVVGTASATTLYSRIRTPYNHCFGTASGSALTAGSGALGSMTVPASASGLSLYSVTLRSLTLGQTQATKIKLYNKTKGRRQLLSTAVQMDAGEDTNETAATASAIDLATDDISGKDSLVPYIVQVGSGPAPTGITFCTEFR